MNDVAEFECFHCFEVLDSDGELVEHQVMVILRDQDNGEAGQLGAS